MMPKAGETAVPILLPLLAHGGNNAIGAVRFGTGSAVRLYLPMDISWRDVAGVEEPGDYPFRDGTIAVTFAEIAVWKKQPDARFQLMRKHPLQAQARYVLGKQLDQMPATDAGHAPFYTSSNGDSWSLAKDPTSGAAIVNHQPNPSSGGKASFLDMQEFLGNDASGPEHQALRQLMKKKASTILIAYDVHPPYGTSRDRLIDAIRTLGAWWHHLETVWIVRSHHTPHEILENLRGTVGDDDQLLVVDISGDTASWSGINASGDKWLKDSIPTGFVEPEQP